MYPVTVGDSLGVPIGPNVGFEMVGLYVSP